LACSIAAIASIYLLPNRRLLRLGLQRWPPSLFGRHPKHILSFVLIRVFRVRPFVFPLSRHQRPVQLLKGIGDVLQEDQPQHNVLILCRVDVLPQLVRRLPELLLQRLIALGFGFLRFGHW
jgi:hypothetical protein